MRVRVKEDYVPYVGRRGEIVEIPDAEARTLVLVGKVEEVVDRVDDAALKAPPVETTPTEAPPVDTATERAKRRRYNRRDMGAEPR